MHQSRSRQDFFGVRGPVPRFSAMKIRLEQKFLGICVPLQPPGRSGLEERHTMIAVYVHQTRWRLVPWSFFACQEDLEKLRHDDGGSGDGRQGARTCHIKSDSIVSLSISYPPGRKYITLKEFGPSGVHFGQRLPSPLLLFYCRSIDPP